MSTTISLIRNIIASGWGKISTIIFRLVQVPFLLVALGVDEYGRWLVLSSIPSWLVLANMGFGTIAANEMAMAVAANDLKYAKIILSTTLTLITGIAILGFFLITIISPFIPWDVVFNVPIKRHNELNRAVIYLALSVLISFFGEIYYGRFRAARKAHQGIFIYTFRPWVELLLMFITMQFSTQLNSLALAILLSTVIFTMCLQWLSRRGMPELSFSWNLIQKKNFISLFVKGFAFQAFPLGNALLFQGNLLIVQSILGPIAVALFGTVRTLVRSINQVLELINQVIWPELSYLIGASEFKKAARLHRLGVAISVFIACLCVIALSIFGQKMYTTWTGNTIKLQQNLLLLFLLPIPFNSLWFTSSVVHTASNQHEGLAIRYLFATIMSAFACGGLSYLIGIKGAAISTLLADLILIPYVLKQSLVLTHDTFDNFFYELSKEAKLAYSYFEKIIK